MSRQHIGILGGTFDPIHLGHLRIAVELLESLCLDQLKLVPVGSPPHRARPAASAQQRLNMLCGAVGQSQQLCVDERECRSPDIAYTFDTLRQLRAELGEEVALSLCLGADAFLGMHRWHCWRELPTLAHIVVTTRPGWTLPVDLGPLECWRDRFLLAPGECVVDAGAVSDRLREHSAGRIVCLSLTPMDISATDIRRRVAQGRSVRFLVPDSVWHYIQHSGLYSGAGPEGASRQEPHGVIPR